MSVIVSTESAMLAQPADIALDENGLLYAVDYLAHHIVVISPDGKLLQTIGREGSGPREFKRPAALALSGDTIRVVDTGNGRVQTLALSSDFTRAALLPGVSSMGPIAVGADGRFVITTLGMFDALAAYHDPSGHQVGTLGTPLAPVSQVMSPTEAKREIIGGKIPAMFRNSVLPVFGAHGDVWLILNGEAQLQRFEADGSLQLSATLDAPEVEQVWEECVQRARETLDEPRHLPGLFYVWDAAVVGQTLWILLNTTAHQPAVLAAVTPDGHVKRRVLFSEVLGAQQFVFDGPRRRVYFAIPSAASIVSSSLPDGIFAF